MAYNSNNSRDKKSIRNSGPTSFLSFYSKLWDFIVVWVMKNTITNNGMKLSMIRQIMHIEEGVKTVQLQRLLLSFFWLPVQLASTVSKLANIFQIWSMLAGYEELAGGFRLIRNWEIFWMNTHKCIHEKVAETHAP